MPNPRTPGTWLEGGRILFGPRYSDELMIVPASGDSPPQPVTKKEPDLGLGAGHRWAAPLPDGKRFLFVEWDYDNGTSSIRVGSLDSLDSRVLLPRRPVAIGRLSVVKGYALYIRDRVLLAHPFDPKRAEFTGDPKALLDGAKVSSFSVSEGGVLVWVPARDEQAADPRITWLDRSGKTLETLTDLPDRVGSPRLSRDGKYLVFDARSEDLDNIWNLFIYDLARSSFRRVHANSSLMGVWSPDGERIAHFAGGIWIADAAGTSPPEPAYPGQEENDDIGLPWDWSPDGRHIAFSRSDTLWILPVGEDKPFAYVDGGEHHAAFAPNGKWIAYASEESGRYEVYVDSFPTPGARFQVSIKGGDGPRWSQDGRELFFMVGAEQSDLVEFHAVEVEETEDGGLNFGTPVKLFDARCMVWNNYYDVTADGQRFVMPILPHTAPLPIHVLADWRRGLEN